MRSLKLRRVHLDKDSTVFKPQENFIIQYRRITNVMKNYLLSV
jgi:hypothetical protein